MNDVVKSRDDVQGVAERRGTCLSRSTHKTVQFFEYRKTNKNGDFLVCCPAAPWVSASHRDVQRFEHVEHLREVRQEPQVEESFSIRRQQLLRPTGPVREKGFISIHPPASPPD